MVTVAGTGTAGSVGDGGAATSAQLNSPACVAVDSHGNLYVADTANHKVRVIDASTHIIYPYAGTGSAGSAGDGAAAASAQLYSPVGLALDGSANLYVTDSSNRVRLVTASTGIIATVAGTGMAGSAGDGGAATSAQLAGPTGVAVDASATTLYVADTGNRKVRLVTASTGLITTFFDGSFAGSSPAGVAVDSSGNLYIAEFGSFQSTAANTVRLVTKSTGSVSIIAGGGSGGDGGLGIRAFLHVPVAVAVDTSSNVFIAELLGYKVRVVTATTGIITTYAGTGVQGQRRQLAVSKNDPATNTALSSPMGVAVDSANTVYVADAGSNKIRLINLPVPSAQPTPAPTQAPTTAPSKYPTARPWQPSSQPTSTPTAKTTAVPPPSSASTAYGAAVSGTAAVVILLYLTHRYRKKTGFKISERVAVESGDDEETKEGGEDFYFDTSDTHGPSPTALVLPPIKPFS